VSFGLLQESAVTRTTKISVSSIGLFEVGNMVSADNVEILRFCYQFDKRKKPHSVTEMGPLFAIRLFLRARR
jgi:uncharacterized protein YfkK (UPF0435 family)